MASVEVRAAAAVRLERRRDRGAQGSIEVVTGAPEAMSAARGTFEREHCVRLAGFLSGELFEDVAGPLRDAAFAPEAHGVGHNLMLAEPLPAADLLLFAMNDPRLLESIGRLTGVDGITSFGGRVYRVEPSSGQALEWHDDRGDPARLVAMSVNLGTEPFAGGTLQIRDRRSGEIVHESANVGPGDAALFRVADFLEHRVAPVEGSVPRTAYAGWFGSHPRFLPHGLSEARRGSAEA